MALGEILKSRFRLKKPEREKRPSEIDLLGKQIEQTKKDYDQKINSSKRPLEQTYYRAAKETVSKAFKATEETLRRGGGINIYEIHLDWGEREAFNPLKRMASGSLLTYEEGGVKEGFDTFLRIMGAPKELIDGDLRIGVSRELVKSHPESSHSREREYAVFSFDTGIKNIHMHLEYKIPQEVPINASLFIKKN